MKPISQRIQIEDAMYLPTKFGIRRIGPLPETLTVDTHMVYYHRTYYGPYYLLTIAKDLQKQALSFIWLSIRGFIHLMI